MIAKQPDQTHLAANVTVADPKLAEIARVLVENVHPVLVMLFGSRMRGDAREDSDYDLAVVIADDADVTAVRNSAYSALRAIAVYADVLVWRSSEYCDRRTDPGFLDSLVASDGLLLYTSGAIPQRAPMTVRESSRSRQGVAMWLKRADSDMRNAEHALTAVDPPIDTICFHAYAATEKLLKALIVHQTHKFPRKTHDLTELLPLVPEQVRNSRVVRDACQLLMTVYPKSRYPENDMPTMEDTHAALAAARAVRSLVMPQLAPSA